MTLEYSYESLSKTLDQAREWSRNRGRRIRVKVCICGLSDEKKLHYVIQDQQ